MPLTERSKNFAISTNMTGMRALEIAVSTAPGAALMPPAERSAEQALSLVIRHERWIELHRRRKLNDWLEYERRRNLYSAAYAQRRFEMLRDAVVPSNRQDHVIIWKTLDGIHVMRSESDVIGIL